VVAAGNQAEIIGVYPRLPSINHNRWLLFQSVAWLRMSADARKKTAGPKPRRPNRF
jgi:hypothetical protein